MSVVVLEPLLVALLKKLKAQVEVSSGVMIVPAIENFPDKAFSLELIPLEGKDVDLATYHEIDAQSIHLLAGQKLIVTLHKKYLFYRQVGQTTPWTNYNVQNSLRVDDWNGWKNWVFDYIPLKCTGDSFNNFYNNCSYQAGNDSGKVTISFISETYPRYYSSLRVIIDE